MVHERKKLTSWTSSKFKMFELQKTPLKNKKTKNKLEENTCRLVSRIYILKKPSHLNNNNKVTKIIELYT